MNKELKLLYRMCKNLQNIMDNISKQELRNVSGYVENYNMLLKQIEKIDKNVGKYCKIITINYGVIYDEINEIGYWNAAKGQLSNLIIYLEKDMDVNEELSVSMISFLKNKLRPIIREKPQKEKEIQDSVETILKIKEYVFNREKITIPYSSKSFIPDFTFDKNDTALEIKLCNRSGKEKELIDEINGDIKAYKTKYSNLIFLIYDLGYINDIEKFKKDISNGVDIYVEVIKH